MFKLLKEVREIFDTFTWWKGILVGSPALLTVLAFCKELPPWAMLTMAFLLLSSASVSYAAVTIFWEQNKSQTGQWFIFKEMAFRPIRTNRWTAKASMEVTTPHCFKCFARLSFGSVEGYSGRCFELYCPNPGCGSRLNLKEDVDIIRIEAKNHALGMNERGELKW